MRWRLVLIVLAAVTAGCGGFIGGEQTPTVTPAGLPATETPTPQQERLAPGIAEYGVADVNALAAAHRESLEGQSYTRYERMNITPQMVGPAPTRTMEQRVAVENETTYAVFATRTFRPREQSIRPLRNYSAYGSGGTVYARYRFAGEDQMRYSVQTNGSGTERFRIDIGQRIIRFLDADRTNVTVTEYRGQRYYLIRGRGPQTRQLRPLQELTVRAYVSKSGFVRAMTAEYLAGSSGRVSRYHYHFEYRKVGETTVDRPEWIETAMAAINSTSTNGTSTNDTSINGTPANGASTGGTDTAGG
ncbi:MAG: hypothetical protein ABEH35_07720 [Haloarculaceae archaeon]